MKVSNNWRTSVADSSIDVISCDTLLPTDSVSRTPLLFNIRPANNHVTDLKNSRLYVDFRVEKKYEDEEGNSTWGPIQPTDNVTLHNNTAFALFSDGNVHLNGVLASTAMREYPRLSYVQNMYFEDSRSQAVLQTAFFMEDKNGMQEEIEKNNAINPGEAIRSNAIVNNKTVSLVAPIYLDLFQAENGFIPDYVDCVLRMFPAPTKFIVFTTEDDLELRVVFEKAELHVIRCRLKVPVPKSISTEYPCVKVLNYLSPKGQRSFNRELNLYKIPDRVAAIVLTEEQYLGIGNSSVIKFNHHNVSAAMLKCNSKCYPRPGGMRFDFSAEKFNEMYEALFSQLGAKNPLFSHQAMDNGYCLFGFSLDRESRQKAGSCSLFMEFSEAPTENLVILVLCFYTARYTISAGGVFRNTVDLNLQ